MKGRIRRRSENSWELTIDVGRDAQGRRQRKFVNVQGKKGDAERRLRELLSAAEMGLPVDAGKETLSVFMERWLTVHVAHTTRPRTLHFYRQVSRLYITPVIGHVPIQRLTPASVQAVVAGVLDKGLSPTTARRAYATLHRALECAMKWGLVLRNVCDAIDAPREAEHEVHPPDIETTKALLTKAAETPYGAAFQLMAHTGMRRGEIPALRWDHLDLENGTLSVTAAAGRENGKLVITPPKSKTSRRMIHLDPETVGALRAHRSRQAGYRLQLGGAYEDHGYVFASPFGRLLDPDILTKAWRSVCGELGVEYRLHDLRHHHATALIEAGVHIKAVQTRLGHSSPSLTMAVYAHVSPAMDKQAAEAYGRAMSR